MKNTLLLFTLSFFLFACDMSYQNAEKLYSEGSYQLAKEKLKEIKKNIENYIN